MVWNIAAPITGDDMEVNATTIAAMVENVTEKVEIVTEQAVSSVEPTILPVTEDIKHVNVSEKVIKMVHDQLMQNFTQLVENVTSTTTQKPLIDAQNLTETHHFAVAQEVFENSTELAPTTVKVSDMISNNATVKDLMAVANKTAQMVPEVVKDGTVALIDSTLER